MKLSIAAVAALGSALAYAGKAASCDTDSIIAHTGEPVGKIEKINGFDMYVTGDAKASNAIVYLTDVFGIQLAENRLLADSFGRGGPFLVVAPDLFNGTPAPADLTTPGFNTGDFLAKHGPEQTDPIIAAAIKHVRGTLDEGAKVGVTGYCYGGRYAFRAGSKAGLGADGARADVIFAAHPSLLDDAEVMAVGGPTSVALAENDPMLAPARRVQIEAMLKNTTMPYSTALYGGTSHGFGVRANISIAVQKFGKEEAFNQAVRWFQAWT